MIPRVLPAFSGGQLPIYWGGETLDFLNFGLKLSKIFLCPLVNQKLLGASAGPNPKLA